MATFPLLGVGGCYRLPHTSELMNDTDWEKYAMGRVLSCAMHIASVVAVLSIAGAAVAAEQDIASLKEKYGFLNAIMEEELRGLVGIISQEEEISDRKNLPNFCSDNPNDDDEAAQEKRSERSMEFMSAVLEKRKGEIRNFVAHFPRRKGRILVQTQGVVAITVEWTLKEENSIGQVASLGWRLCEGYEPNVMVDVRNYDTRDGVELTGEQYLQAHYAELDKQTHDFQITDQWLKYIRKNGALLRFSPQN